MRHTQGGDGSYDWSLASPKQRHRWTYAEYSCSMCMMSLVEYLALPFPPVEAGVSVLVAIGAILLCDVCGMYKRKE